MRKNCSSDREKLLKFEAEDREFAKFLRSLEQFIQTVKGQCKNVSFVLLYQLGTFFITFYLARIFLRTAELCEIAL